MKLFLLILPIFSLLNFQAQTIEAVIDPGDYNSGQRVRTLLRGGINRISAHCHFSHDSVQIQTDNGIIVTDNEDKKYLFPKFLGLARVTIRAFVNGEVIEKKQCFRVLDSPDLKLKVVDDNLTGDNTISFKLYDKELDVTNEFRPRLFEFQILDEQDVIQDFSPCSFTRDENGYFVLDLSFYDLNIKSGQKLILSSNWFMWWRFNVPVPVMKMEIIID